jgi:hypothetical protein
MFLIYINPLGKNYKGEFIYEFIFSNKTEIEFGDDWDIVPASSGTLTPPDVKYIKQVETLKNSEIELELAINSDTFSYSDAVENIVAIAWEKESPDDEKRMVFHYGELMTGVVDKLYARDIVLNK